MRECENEEEEEETVTLTEWRWEDFKGWFKIMLVKQ